MRAFVFPGQGAQTIGMGRELAEAYPAARDVFQQVDEALGEPLSDLIWTGDIDTLTLTQNAQPALMATSLAAFRALESEGFSIRDANFVAGHSLGEYSALCAAGALTLEDTARLLRLRGQAMQEAVPVGAGAMAAILGLDFETVDRIVREIAGDEVVQAANDNDPAQVVISGHKGAVEAAVEAMKAAGAKRAVMLPVSAPFHSVLMQPAAAVMADALAGVDIQPPAVPLIANVRAEAVTEPGAIRRLLVEGRTDRWSPETELLLFTAARRDHLERTIRPALDRGAWVVCDRFADSTRVYQGAARADLAETVETLHRLMIGIEPDRTFIIDLDPAKALARATGRAPAGPRATGPLAPGQVEMGIVREENAFPANDRQPMAPDSTGIPTEDRFEGMGLGFQTALRNGFHALARAHPARLRLIDGSGPAEAVAARVRAAL